MRFRFTASISTLLASVRLFGVIVLIKYNQERSGSPRYAKWLDGSIRYCLELLTNAKGDQILVVAATYAAILLVFVGGNLTVNSIVYSRIMRPRIMIINTYSYSIS